MLAALGPKMLELSGKRAAGAHTYFVTPEHTAQAREVLGSGPLLAPEQAVLLETDPAAARALAREHHTRFYLTLPNYVNSLRRLGFGDEDFAGGGSDRLVDAVVAWGDVEAIQRRVREHHAAGADHVAIQPLAPSGGPGPRPTAGTGTGVDRCDETGWAAPCGVRPPAVAVPANADPGTAAGVRTGYGRPWTCGPTAFDHALPLAASQLVDQVMAPRSPG